MARKKRTSRKRVDPAQKFRDQYRELRCNALYEATPEVWDAAVRALAHKRYGDSPTPEQWVEAAKDATTPCTVCGGSGRYEFGACVNGRMTRSGPCFRCQQKGFFTQADHHRNRVYDGHRKVI